MKRVLLVLAVCLVTVPVSASPVYVASDGFNGYPNNSDPVWTYGRLAGGLFSALTHHIDNYYGMTAYTSGLEYPGTYPLIAFNGTSVPKGAGGGFIVGPGVLSLHPGSLGEQAVVRWTAPATGLYAVNGLFSGLETSTSTDAYVRILSGTESVLHAGSIAAMGQTSAFDLMVSVAAGDALYFAVGYGANHNFNGDSTGLVASVSAVPEPATLSLLGVGLAALARSCRRRA